MGRAIRLGLLPVLVAVVAAGCGGSTKTKTVRETTTVASEVGLPQHRLVLAHRGGPKRREPGYQGLGARPCSRQSGGSIKTVDLYPDVGVCVRLTPHDRLLLVNSTEIATHPSTVTVRLGNYVARVTPGRSALIPAPVGTYLGRGLHSARTSGAPAPSIMVLPEDCGINRLKPSEELCFPKRPGSPR